MFFSLEDNSSQPSEMRRSPRPRQFCRSLDLAREADTILAGTEIETDGRLWDLPSSYENNSWFFEMARVTASGAVASGYRTVGSSR